MQVALIFLPFDVLHVIGKLKPPQLLLSELLCRTVQRNINNSAVTTKYPVTRTAYTCTAVN